MIGIVLISHDDFCVGMLHAAEMICGDLGGQIVTVGLAKDAPVETACVHHSDTLRSVF